MHGIRIPDRAINLQKCSFTVCAMFSPLWEFRMFNLQNKSFKLLEEIIYLALMLLKVLKKYKTKKNVSL